MIRAREKTLKRADFRLSLADLVVADDAALDRLSEWLGIGDMCDYDEILIKCQEPSN